MPSSRFVRAIADEFDLEDTEVCEYMTEASVVSDEDAVVGDAISKMNEAGHPPHRRHVGE